jgi:CBS domain containing-hemolysin-like protein
MDTNSYIIILISILGSAFFSGIEIAFVSANKLKIELDKSRGKIGAKILSWFNKHASNFIAFLLLGNNIALVVYGIYMEQILNQPLTGLLPAPFDSAFFILTAQTIISTIIILIVAEFLPKIIFRINSNKILSFFSFLLAPLYILLTPLVFTFIQMSKGILKVVLRSKIDDDNYTFSSIDLDYYIKEFHDKEAESEDEKDIQIFQNAIEFQELKIRDCMVPRTDIVAVSEDTGLDELKKIFAESGHSKLIVYKDSIDNIIGYVHVFDLFRRPKSIKGILRDLIFVPETMQANTFMSKLIKENKSIAVVLDEFGGTSGIITLEDLMEEIFGEIEDEFDHDQLVERKIDDHTFIFSARQEIDHLNQTYELGLEEHDEYETLGGYIIHHHESIPRKGEHLEINGKQFEILAAGNTKIDLIKLRIPPKEE